MGVVVAVLAGLTLFLGLAVLGSMRETVFLRGEVAALSYLMKNPPPPSYLGGSVPDVIRGMLESEPVSSATARWLVAFLAPGCGPCEDIVTGLSDAVQQGDVRPADLFFVVWAERTRQTERFASRLPGRAVIDDTGVLARKCEVRATPMLFIVSRDDFAVTDYSPEGGVEWILKRLTPAAALIAP
jgi:hypothetical protein